MSAIRSSAKLWTGESCCINETAEEWIAKADGDYATASRELAVRNDPNYDAVCYHAQQCIDKLMKGVLVGGNVVPPRTHNPVDLSALLQPLHPTWQPSQEDLRFLTEAAVAFRYPGDSADQATAQEAVEICSRLRDDLKAHLAHLA